MVKSSYGLKQAPIQWHENFDIQRLHMDLWFMIMRKNTYKLNNNEGVIIYLYVNDLLIFWISHNVVYDTKCVFASKFDMKILVEANVILGIKILRDNDCIVLSQSHYMEKKELNTLIYDLCLLWMT